MLDDDIVAAARQLLDICKRKNTLIATAESCTAGLVAGTLTELPGVSSILDRGYVTYSNAQKSAQLGVPDELFPQVGAVSREVVEAMARGAQARSGARFTVAVSGIAGPDGGSPEKPVGTVWLCWADGEHCYPQRFLFSGDRLAVRRQAVAAALDGVLRLAVGENPVRG